MTQDQFLQSVQEAFSDPWAYIHTRAGVNRTVGAIDLEANGFFSEIPPEVVDEAGNPVTVTETAAALPQMNGSGMVRNLRAAMSLSMTSPGVG